MAVDRRPECPPRGVLLSRREKQKGSSNAAAHGSVTARQRGQFPGIARSCAAPRAVSPFTGRSHSLSSQERGKRGERKGRRKKFLFPFFAKGLTPAMKLFVGALLCYSAVSVLIRLLGKLVEIIHSISREARKCNGSRKKLEAGGGEAELWNWRQL